MVTKSKQEQNRKNPKASLPFQPLTRHSKTSSKKLNSSNDAASNNFGSEINPEENSNKSQWMVEENKEIGTHEKCEVCGRESTLKCSRCRWIYYCSKKHQTEDWCNHKPLCKILSPHGFKIVKEDDRDTDVNNRK